MSRLLHHDREIHVLVNGAVEVVGAGGVEGADGVAVVAVEHQIANGWGAGLGFGLWAAVDPRTIGDDVNDRGIIYQIDTAALADGDAGLREVVAGHVDGVRAAGTATIATTGTTAARTAARTGTAAAGDEQDRDQAQNHKSQNKLFHGYKCSL